MVKKPLMTDQLYFQAHGLEVAAPAVLEDAVRQAIEWLPVGLYTESAQGLPGAEIELLRASGLNPVAEDGHDPMAETIARFAALLRTSLSTTEAAERLGVHVSRIRQMLASDLYGIKINGRWRIPAFQLTDTGLAPNIGAVNAALDHALHPVAVYRWYTTPDPDLETESGVLSPLAWLSAGYDTEVVRKLAAEL